MLFNGLPIYDLLIDDNEINDGMYCVSLVEYPAVESNWQAFSKDKKENIKFSIVNEDEKKIFGVVCRADFPIYRCDDWGNEWYVTFSCETIRKMAEKFFKNGFQGAINLEHDDKQYVDCVNLQEMFIKDTKKGVSPKGFEDISDGSLFAMYQITDDDLWKDIKDGKFKGFSLEGYFSPTPIVEKEPTIETLKDLLEWLK